MSTTTPGLAVSLTSSTAHSTRLRGGSAAGCTESDKSLVRWIRVPGCERTRRSAGIEMWITSGRSSMTPPSHSAVAWLAAAPDPAPSTAAQTEASSPTGPVKVAYTPGSSSRQRPFATFRRAWEQDRPKASSWLRPTIPCCCSARQRHGSASAYMGAALLMVLTVRGTLWTTRLGRSDCPALWMIGSHPLSRSSTAPLVWWRPELRWCRPPGSWNIGSPCRADPPRSGHYRQTAQMRNGPVPAGTGPFESDGARVTAGLPPPTPARPARSPPCRPAPWSAARSGSLCPAWPTLRPAPLAPAGWTWRR